MSGQEYNCSLSHTSARAPPTQKLGPSDDIYELINIQFREKCISGAMPSTTKATHELQDIAAQNMALQRQP